MFFDQTGPMRIQLHAFSTLTLAALLQASAARATDANPLPDGLVIDLRYRHAHIDEAGFSQSANADTLRITLGYLWQLAPDWSAYAEGTRVVSFGDSYNSGANGMTHRPMEGDPPSSEISSAWLGYDNGDERVRVGRQYVNLDNQRFFTSGLWRQNPQSFDAFNGTWTVAATGTTLQYLHLNEAQRSVGHDYPDPTQREWSLDANLFHVDQKLVIGTLSGYEYLVENDTTLKYSWRTAGLRWTGAQSLLFGNLGWTAEVAQQHAWRNNPGRYAADYHLLELTYGVPALSLRAGDELRGGDGHNAFSSPYGSNHAFDGWTNQFKNTPANGVEDRYFGVFGKLGDRFTWSALAHNFFADRGRQRYGSEINAMLGCALQNGVSVEIDYASYHRDTFGNSERELWLTLEYRNGKRN